MTQGEKRPVPSVVEVHPNLYSDRSEGRIIGREGEYVRLIPSDYKVWVELLDAKENCPGGWCTIERLEQALYSKKKWKVVTVLNKYGELKKRRERVVPHDPKGAIQNFIWALRKKIRTVHDCSCVIEYSRCKEAYRLTAYGACRPSANS